ncbi:acid-sensing ion channel 1-like [Porites lutea]|uniref:acid-sensing ion channel 1-like n=1 Tax=Porites lutea TaxID=51062 RepID=UPI003CC61D3B
MAQLMLSHQIEEMLLPVSPQFHSCSVNGKKCTANNFTSHMSSLYGLCYTFNSLKSGRPLLYATLSGKNSGLRLLLNIERDSYLATNIRPTVGLAIIIHDQKSFPFMDDFGTTVQPGISTLCAFRKRKIVNLKAPYETNCTNRSLDMFNSDVYAYTKRACMIKCRNDYTVKRCGCTPPEFKADAPICAPNDSVLCVYNSYEEFGASSEKESCDKNCPEPCEHVEYETSFSYSALQPESFVDHLMDFLKSNDTSVDRAIYEPLLNMTPSERERYIEKNIISLDIYFEDLSYEIIEQTPVYETWTMIGSLGGTFGLFLGMSLLTILEFLDFIFARICHLLQGLHSGNRHTGTIHAEF